MLLCLDVGNTHLFAGVYRGEELILRFRYAYQLNQTSDQLGLFFKHMLKEHAMDEQAINNILIASVVPSLDFSLTHACEKYFQITPNFIHFEKQHLLKFNVKHAGELGADRVACAMGALDLYPKQPLLLMDFGTATTLCAISSEGVYLGGSILPGLKTSMMALSQNAAKLPEIHIAEPNHALGTTTNTQILSGLYYGHLGALRELVGRLKEEAFSDNTSPVCIATGGFAHLYADKGIFSEHHPTLIFHGLRLFSKILTP